MAVKGVRPEARVVSAHAELPLLAEDVHAVASEADEQRLLDAIMSAPDRLPSQPLADPVAEARRLARRAAVSSAWKSAPVVVPGGAVVYVGRLPRGLDEDALRRYFGQFGALGRVRLRRSPRTGGSRHAGFVEFRDADVAAIAAETMHNYLIHNHLLQVRVMAPETLHAALWKGAHSPFVLVDGPKRRAEKHNAGARVPTAAEAAAELAAAAARCAAIGYDAGAAAVGALEDMI